MNREILFRGKAGNKWYFGYPIEYLSKKQYISVQGEAFPYEVIPETIGRYTGLTDKNGRRIFEGDILQRNSNPKDIVIVTFGKFPIIDTETESEVDEVIGWYCNVIPTDALSKTRPFCLPMPLTDYYIDRCNIEVIGNIHDDLELLGYEENA